MAKLVRESRVRARLQKRPISEADFIDVLDPPGARPDAATLRRIAVHEAGHVVAAYRLLKATDLNVSIVASGDNRGAVRFTHPNTPLTRDLVEKRLIQLMAGRAAEQVFVGDVSSGAGGSVQSDLGQATALAIKAVTRLGLGHSTPLAWLGIDESRPLSDYPADVRNEVVEMLSTAFDDAVALIESEWDFVNCVGETLLRTRALSHKEIVILDRKPVRRPDILDFHRIRKPPSVNRDLYAELKKRVAARRRSGQLRPSQS